MTFLYIVDDDNDAELQMLMICKSVKFNDNTLFSSHVSPLSTVRKCMLQHCASDTDNST